MKSKPSARVNTRQETVFLSGTDQVKDVISVLYGALQKMGFKPLWFKRHFPQLHGNAMDNCIEVARISDRMIVVIDERSGLTYKNTGRSITEEEFNVGHKRDIPILVFVRDQLWYQSSVFHKYKKAVNRGGKIGFSDLFIDGDEETYEFIERLQHCKHGDKSHVPWITPFDLPERVVRTVKEKWFLSQKDSANAISLLRQTLSRTPETKDTKRKFQPENRVRSGRVLLVDNAVNELKKTPPTSRKMLLSAIMKLGDSVASGQQLPLIMRRGSDDQEVFVLRISGFIISFSRMKGMILILEIMRIN